MDAINVFGLLAVIVTNIGAITIAHIKREKRNSDVIGIKNGRGSLITQVGKLQDDIVEVREDVAELKGILTGYIKST
mgnify:CR=1 FL=1|jgi:hypothetical protein|tara:strand:+ start:2485 stop:2715 length:231 start_codon:yes stop_codon:yes gene_type:complete